MKLYVILFMLCVLCTYAILSARETPKGKSKPVSFSNDVFPIIKKHCLPCHAEDSDNPSELYLESYADLMKGGKHGTPLVPKKGDESIIIQKLKADPPFGKQMPLMTKKKLTDEEIEVFKKWIDEGAKKN
ncbi:MAG TPA: c-type cytochrome domain-containing protein [Bacteroidota bacterium]|nr:c-type cytochrome domain-containing protein [Bacteroidota bacterium]